MAVTNSCGKIFISIQTIPRGNNIKSLLVPRLPLSIEKLLCHHSNFISLSGDYA